MNLVQLGANDGYDHVLRFIKESNIKFDNILLVEPMPLVINKLKENYKDIENVSIEEVAIVSDDSLEEVNIFYDTESPNHQVSSLDKKYLKDHGPGDERISQFIVQAMTFDKLMTKHELTNIEYLYTDCEGMDFKILLSIDFDKFNIENIFFESFLPSFMPESPQRNEEYTQLMGKFQRYGYKLKNTNIEFTSLATKI
jgi:FkbM family methyltransferase